MGLDSELPVFPARDKFSLKIYYEQKPKSLFYCGGGGVFVIISLVIFIANL